MCIRDSIIGVVFIIYSIMELTPGDPVMMILGEGAPIEAQEALREQMGLNAPFLVRFVKYVIGALHGDLGTSYTSNLPVFNAVSYTHLFMERAVRLGKLSTTKCSFQIVK